MTTTDIHQENVYMYWVLVSNILEHETLQLSVQTSSKLPSGDDLNVASVKLKTCWKLRTSSQRSRIRGKRKRWCCRIGKAYESEPTHRRRMRSSPCNQINPLSQKNNHKAWWTFCFWAASTKSKRNSTEVVPPVGPGGKKDREGKVGVDQNKKWK